MTATRTSTPAVVVPRLREGFSRGITKPLAWRRRQLEALRRLLRLHGTELEDALAT